MPCLTKIFENSAEYELFTFFIGDDQFSEVENTKDVLLASPTHIKPADNVALGTRLSISAVKSGKVTVNDMSAVAAVLERGTYPIFLANETTF